MQVPELPYVTVLVDEVVDGLEGADRTRWKWTIHGQPTFGKSRLLTDVARRLRDLGRRVLLVRPPLGTRDSGMIAASQMSYGFYVHDHRNGDLHETVHDPSVTWATKLKLLQDALEGTRDEVIVLADDPGAWGGSVHHPYQQASVLGLLVQGLATKVVITSSRGTGLARDGQVRECRPGTSYASWLSSPEWGPLADAARRLEARDDRLGLSQFSPLQVRMLVAYADLTSADAAGQLVGQARAAGHDLPGALYLALAGEFEEVRRLWRRLAHLRTPFDEKLLAELGAPSIDATAGALLRTGLLFGDEHRYVLHDALRRVPRSGVTEDTHRVRVLFSHYYQRRAIAEGSIRGYEFELEAFHHASTALDLDEIDLLRPLFAEQVWLLTDRLFEAGRHDEARDYLNAVSDRVRPSLGIGERPRRGDRRATSPASSEPSSGGHSAAFHQRLAFAADAGCDAAVAEKHYEEALRLDSRDPQLHARYICFLLDLGRVREARAAWERASTTLPDPGELEAEQLEVLHAQVAWRLVRAHDLDFAETVLDGAPPFATDALPALRSVAARLRALRLSQRHGPVLPFGLLVDGWWRRRPAELPEELEGQPLRAWWAGRVELADEEGVVIEVAEVDVTDAEEPVPAVAELTARDLEEAGWAAPGRLEPGDFLVAGIYGDAGRMLIRSVVAPDTRIGLPRPELDPQRYLKHHRLAA